MIVHLIEIRRRALRTMLFFVFMLSIFVLFSQQLLEKIIAPLLKVLPAGVTLIATNVTSPVITPINLAINAALLFTAPVLLYHIWRFILPGLYLKEKHMIRGIIISSLSLFILGSMAAFYIILPWMLSFFAQSVPHGVHFAPEMNGAIDFITNIMFVFGICFQIPLLCPVLVVMGFTDTDSLKKVRPYVIVAAFIFGMLITPPDVTSQIIVAIPCCLLYEIGILLARRYSSQMNNF